MVKTSKWLRQKTDTNTSLVFLAWVGGAALISLLMIGFMTTGVLAAADSSERTIETPIQQPGEDTQVELEVVVGSDSDSVTVTDEYNITFSSASIESVEVNGEPAEPTDEDIDESDGLSVELEPDEGFAEDDVINIVYSVQVPDDQANETVVSFDGDASFDSAEPVSHSQDQHITIFDAVREIQDSSPHPGAEVEVQLSVHPNKSGDRLTIEEFIDGNLDDVSIQDVKLNDDTVAPNASFADSESGILVALEDDDGFEVGDQIKITYTVEVPEDISDGETVEFSGESIMNEHDPVRHSSDSSITVEVEEENGSENGDDNGGGGPGAGSGGGGGGGGGGGSGGGLPSIDPSDIDPPSDADVAVQGEGTIRSGENESVGTFGDFLDDPVTEQVRFERSDIDAETRTRDYDGITDEIEAPPGNSVTVSEILIPPEFQDESARLIFNIENAEHSELSSDAINTDELTVWRHTDGEWEPLETTAIDDAYIEAETPGFSYFAITDSDEHSQTESETGEQEETEDVDDSIPGFGMVAAMIAIALFVRLKIR